jgi:hypothetical protein
MTTLEGWADSMALRATGLSDDYISDNCEMIIISVDSASIQDVQQIALIDSVRRLMPHP